MLQICRAEMKDAEIQVQIIKQAFAPLQMRYHDECSPVYTTEEQVREKICNPLGVYLKAIYDKQQVGGIYAYMSNEVKKEMYLSSLQILPEYQGKGIAKRLIAALEEGCRCARCWWLQVPEDQPVNRYVYESAGYRNTEKKFQMNEFLTLVLYRKECNG